MAKKSTKKSGVSHKAIAAADKKPPVKTKRHSVGIPAKEFFDLLDEHISPDIGKCPEGFTRELTWQCDPEQGVIIVIATDAPIIPNESKTVQ